VRRVSERCEVITSLNTDLERRCLELDTINTANKVKIDRLEEKGMEMKKGLEVETGSLDDLSRLVQAKLDLSSELDNTLLSQVAAGVIDTNNSTGISEVQRLLKKIQNDGIKLLSLSKRLVLIKHASIGQEMAGDVENGNRGPDERGKVLLEF
jgi:hypothetical protein